MNLSHRQHLRRLGRDEHGAALVEFALVFVLLLVLVFGIIDFGRALYTSNTINLAAREGARYASVCDNPATQIAAIKDTVIAHMSPFGGPALTASQVTVTPNYGTGGVLQSTTVRVNYPFTPLTPVYSLLGLPSLTLHAQAQYRWELGS